MPSSVFDSFYFKDRFGTAAMRALWSDRATITRWLEVEAALASVQADLGLVPEKAAKEIARKARIENLDLRSMKRGFDRTWNPVVPLLDELRKKLGPEAKGVLHWGATSKNIFDTGLVLQIKDSYELLLAHLWTVADRLAAIAEEHRGTLMAGRTHGQHALPVTFGFKAAVWLDEILRHEERLEESRSRVLVGEFGGAVGTLASLGGRGLQVEERLMERLGLGVAAVPVKTAGDRIAEFALLVSMLSATLGKIAQNIYNLQQTDIDEVAECTEGKIGSSAMPHKQNPVASGSVVLLGRLLRANAIPALDYIHAEGEDDHRQGETAWKFVPEICLLADAQLALTSRLFGSLVVKPENMKRNVERELGFLCSESLLMKLSSTVGREQAHELVRDLCDDAREKGRPLGEVASENSIVSRSLSAAELSSCLAPEDYLGETTKLVNRVLSSYRKRRKTRKRP
ncbi:MAG: class-II fumarase/aspartase family protein [Vicinamibacteria bacterium]